MEPKTEDRPRPGEEAAMIRFTSKAGADITMFERPAMTLIRMMGHSGTVPSAVLAEDIGAALATLRHRLARHTDAEDVSDEDDADPDDRPVGLSTRAYPLVRLLESAEKRQVPLMWDRFTGTLI